MHLNLSAESSEVSSSTLNALGENTLRERLKNILLESSRIGDNVVGLVGSSITSGFPTCVVDEIISCFSKDFNEKVLLERTSLIGRRYNKMILEVTDWVKSEKCFFKPEPDTRNKLESEVELESAEESDDDGECIESNSDSN